MASVKNILSHPGCYHHLRSLMLLGLPFRRWVDLYGLSDSRERVADLGCGPADILRYLSPERRPQFYLGIDLSDRYLAAAEIRARKAGLDARFLPMDLSRLPTDDAVAAHLLEVLRQHAITRVVILGVIHHIDDDSALRTLNLVHQAATVNSLVTQDVIRIPGRGVNNFFCSLDRGQFIRTEPQYDALMQRTDWKSHDKKWTHPGIRGIRYIHYLLRR
jgi:SAM-dependent methyltransferase